MSATVTSDRAEEGDDPLRTTASAPKTCTDPSTAVPTDLGRPLKIISSTLTISSDRPERHQQRTLVAARTASAC